jgi:hypothetical protein
VILGLCGAAGSGKSSVALRLHAEHGYASWAFADPLYAAVAAITGLEIAELQNRERKERVLPWLGTTPRRLLQTLGTEWGRGIISDTIWIDSTFRRIDASGWDRHVISDVRFTNEAEAVIARGGHVLRVERPDSACLDAQAAAHASEAGIPDSLVLATIQNSGSLADLDAAVDSLIASLQVDTMR